jgi:hypothetical protein
LTKQNASNGADLSADQFNSLLRSSKPGESITYHIGEMGYKIDMGDEQLKKLQSAVYERYEAGECWLFQRKLGERRYEYVAIKSNRVPQYRGHDEQTPWVKSSALPAQFVV